MKTAAGITLRLNFWCTWQESNLHSFQK